MTDGRPEALSRGRDVEASLTDFLVVLLPVETGVARAVRDIDRQSRHGAGDVGEGRRVVLAGIP